MQLIALTLLLSAEWLPADFCREGFAFHCLKKGNYTRRLCGKNVNLGKINSE